jgi:transposase-like protein
MGKKHLTFPERMRLVNPALGRDPEATARAMGENPSTTYHWLKCYKAGGTESLRGLPRGKPREKKVTQEVHSRLHKLHQENPSRSAAKAASLYEAEVGRKLHRNTVLLALKKGDPIK